MRYKFIDAEKAVYPILVLARVLKVSRSGYYAWLSRKTSPRAVENARLLELIREIHASSRRCYGSPRITRELRSRKIRVSKNRVARLMRIHGIRSLHRRRFRLTTRSSRRRPVAPNLLQRNFTAEQPNQVWAGDITYIWTVQGWLYLAVLLDLYSRRVVGWSMSERITDDLTISALEMALQERRPDPGLIHHTDRGSQYASGAYLERLGAHGLRASMSRRGDCWDNAVSESFFASLEKELLRDRTFISRNQARHAIFDYIEVFYNRARRHSTINYLSPADFEALPQEGPIA